MNTKFLINSLSPDNIRNHSWSNINKKHMADHIECTICGMKAIAVWCNDSVFVKEDIACNNEYETI